MNSSVFILLLFCIIAPLKAQKSIQIAGLLPKMDTAQRDSLQNVTEGYTILNTSTNCINYRVQNQWFELCGHCTPYPESAKIDSVVYENGEASLFFSPTHLGCTYTVSNDLDGKLLKGTASPIVTKELKENAAYRFKCLAQSTCGESEPTPWSPSFVLRSIDYCQGETELKIESSGKKYAIKSIGKACWMTENLALDPSLHPSDKEVKVTNTNTFFSWQYANFLGGDTKSPSGVCPAGWHLPNAAQAKAMIDAFRKNPNLNFFNTTQGAFDFNKKEVLFKDLAYYWTNQTNSFLLSAKQEPMLLQSEDAVGMSVRCVKD